jgi:hypothetical protein
MDYTLSDIASVMGGEKSGGSFGGILMIVIVFLFVVMLGGGRGFGGADYGPGPGYVTQGEFTAGLNNLGTQNSLQAIALSSANNNYETAQLINGQTNTLMEQNNTNLINAIQGFNAVNLSIQNQTNVLAMQVQALQAKMDDCCCAIKTQMLQNRLDDAQAALVAKNADISNYNQSQYLLGQLGRFVAWAGTGAPAATAVPT